MKSLKKQLVFTSALVSSFAFVALLIQIYSNALLYRHLHNLTNNQLPFTMELNELGEDLNASLASLKNWVLLGDQESKKGREKLWLNHIEPTLSSLKLRIAKSGDSKQQILFEEMSASMRLLNSSQWWVEDVSNFIGNQPALVLYQRDLLPIYSHIQSALQGIDSPLVENDASTDLQLLVSNAHVLLSETMHQLSQVIITGEVTHINRFREHAHLISNHLEELAITSVLDEDAKKLALWISGQYNNYVNLAEKITQKRLASDWNQGLYILNYETIPLTEAILKSLLQLRQSQIQKLQADSQWTESTSFSALAVSIMLLLISAVWAIYYSLSHAQKLVDKINRLRMSARNVAQGKQMQLNVHFVDELDELAKTFNQMQMTLFRRRKKFVRERERLSEIIHIISHDIKAPLINIKGHTKLINNDLEDIKPVDQKQSESIIDMQESLKHIMFSSDRISILIKRILKFSSVIQQEIKMLPVNPKQIIQDLIVLNSARVHPEQLTLSNIPSEIISDVFSLQIIFSTLLDNAIKYQHPERELAIHISYEHIASLKLHKFLIVDNGLGILVADREKVFKLFVKSGTVNSGSGIGLANARSLAEKLNGDIEFYNNKNGEGVTFVVSLHKYPLIPEKH
jgi:signal transduction histidine kinase